ncbi:hypothetical protein E4U43_006946, partial [Claviceps pusilla]
IEGEHALWPYTPSSKKQTSKLKTHTSEKPPGQGASQAIEDAVILALTLAAAAAADSPPTELPQWLRTYQAARKPRADQAASASRATGEAFNNLLFSEEGMRFLQNAFAWINTNDLFGDLARAVEGEFGADARLELMKSLM